MDQSANTYRMQAKEHGYEEHGKQNAQGGYQGRGRGTVRGGGSG